MATQEVLKTNQVFAGGTNSRADYTEDVSGLMQSIETLGQLEPIGVVKVNKGYKVVYGFRRFFAIQKLERPTIMAVVHENISTAVMDAMNLAENVQRRNVSLPEIGRYVHLLKSHGLSTAELAVKLGVSRRYLRDSLHTYQRVPQSIRPHLEFRAGDQPKGGEVTPGMVSMRVANAILTNRSYRSLASEHIEKLFIAAKGSPERFKIDQVSVYATNVKAGRDAFDGVTEVKALPVLGHVTLDEYNRIYKKYITEGPFKNMRQVFLALIRGQITERVDI